MLIGKLKYIFKCFAFFCATSVLFFLIKDMIESEVNYNIKLNYECVTFEVDNVSCEILEENIDKYFPNSEYVKENENSNVTIVFSALEGKIYLSSIENENSVKSKKYLLYQDENKYMNLNYEDKKVLVDNLFDATKYNLMTINLNGVDHE